MEQDDGAKKKLAPTSDAQAYWDKRYATAKELIAALKSAAGMSTRSFALPQRPVSPAVGVPVAPTLPVSPAMGALPFSLTGAP